MSTTPDDTLYDVLNLLLEAGDIGTSVEDESSLSSEVTSNDAPSFDDSSDFDSLVSDALWDDYNASELGDDTATSSSDAADAAVEDVETADDTADAVTEVGLAAPLTEADFAGVELSVVLEHALALKAVLDEAGVDLDTQDPMYADYAAEYQAAAAYLASAGSATAEESAVAEGGTAAPLTATDFAGVELSAVVDHALGLKAVLDDAGAALDTQDPMYADYAAEYQSAVAYLASADIIL